MPEIKVYSKVYNKMVSYSFRTVCDINYCSIFKKIDETKAKDIIKTWCDLNEESYCLHHKRERITLKEYISFEYGETISTIQMLKYLQCIRYNIEDCEIKQVRNLSATEEKYLKLLDDAIINIQGVIIGEMPEYQEAEWCE